MQSREYVSGYTVYTAPIRALLAILITGCICVVPLCANTTDSWDLMTKLPCYEHDARGINQAKVTGSKLLSNVCFNTQGNDGQFLPQNIGQKRSFFSSG